MRTEANQSIHAAVAVDGFFNYVGLTKREYFAALAMQGLLARDHNQGRMMYQRTSVEKEAIAAADALIKALNEGDGNE